MTSYLVVGASRGIGLEFVRQLAAASTTSRVFAGCRNPEKLELSFPGAEKTTKVALDVQRQEVIDAALDVIHKANSGTLDVLICNAGIIFPGDTLDTAPEQLAQTLDINTVSVHRIVQAFLPLLRAGSVKKIILLGGTFGPTQYLTTNRFASATGAYAISKTATHMLGMLYGLELIKEGFITASLHPGIVATDMSAQVMAGMKAAGEGGDHGQGGGPQIIQPEDSVRGMVRVMENLQPEQSGKLISWEAEVLPNWMLFFREHISRTQAFDMLSLRNFCSMCSFPKGFLMGCDDCSVCITKSLFRDSHLTSSTLDTTAAVAP